MKTKECFVCDKVKPIIAFNLCRNCYTKYYRDKLRNKGVCIRCCKRKIDTTRSKHYCIYCLNRMKSKYNKDFIKDKKFDKELKRGV